MTPRFRRLAVTTFLIVDVEDAYVFHWLADGAFSAINTQIYEPPHTFDGQAMFLALYVYTTQVGNLIAPDAVSTVGIHVANLQAGDYLLNLTCDCDGADPPYTLTLPDQPQPPISTPEPASGVLLVCGAAMLAVRRARATAIGKCSPRLRGC